MPLLRIVIGPQAGIRSLERHSDKPVGRYIFLVRWV